MTTNVFDLRQKSNSPNEIDDPKWIVLHGGKGSQRRRWGEDMAALVEELKRYGWIIRREGADLVVKHGSRMEGTA